ncbi:hypothetical protein ACFU44_32010 [Nocardia rhizosphaerihabitans]
MACVAIYVTAVTALALTGHTALRTRVRGLINAPITMFAAALS